PLDHLGTDLEHEVAGSLEGCQVRHRDARLLEATSSLTEVEVINEVLVVPLDSPGPDEHGPQPVQEFGPAIAEADALGPQQPLVGTYCHEVDGQRGQVQAQSAHALDRIDGEEYPRPPSAHPIAPRAT